MPPLPYSAQVYDPRRIAYAAELARGTDHFHEPRREDCPWCRSRRLRTRLRAPDLLQHKPGTFALDECRDCGHAFQNPRLTAEGLAFYHRDLHDRNPASLVERVLAARRHSHRAHRAVARLMPAVGEPESWLDVGTGDAGFPAAAREVFPYTSFDGLDPSPRVVRARAAGRIEEAHVGHLADPGIAARLRGRYDVVSVFHHLACVPDPRAELRGALDVLRPGGHLLLELPDPHSASALLLGKWWLPHGQPRHLHLMPLRNLRTELESHGCTVLVVDRRTPHTPYDLSAAVALVLTHVLPAADAPWRSAPPSTLHSVLRAVLTGATSPLVAAAATADHLLDPFLRCTPGFSNTYRIVARRNPT